MAGLPLDPRLVRGLPLRRHAPWHRKSDPCTARRILVFFPESLDARKCRASDWSRQRPFTARRPRLFTKFPFNTIYAHIL